MSVLFSKQGLRSLRGSGAILVLAIATAAGLAWGSHWYVQAQRRDGLATAGQLREAQSRVQSARQERENLEASSALFRDLVNRGLLQPESRLDMIERLDRLKERHRLLGLEYEIGAQRPLPLPGDRAFNAIDVLGSRVRVRALALHEGDALAFFEDLAHPRRGFNPPGRCGLRKLEPGSETSISARVEAECTLEWISLRDKRGARAN